LRIPLNPHLLIQGPRRLIPPMSRRYGTPPLAHQAQTSNQMTVIFLSFLFSAGIVALIFIHRGLPGSSRDIGWKMTGIWRNPKNLDVMLHTQGNQMRGHLVVPGSNNDQPDGALVIRELEVKPLWRWSDGTYLKPGSREEFHVRIKLKSSRKLSVQFIEEKKMEEWRLIDSL
jgi:hypothetical protein